MKVILCAGRARVDRGRVRERERERVKGDRRRGGAKEAKRCAVWRKTDAPSSYLFVPSGIRLPRTDILRWQDIDFARFFSFALSGLSKISRCNISPRSFFSDEAIVAPKLISLGLGKTFLTVKQFFHLFPFFFF